MTRNICLLLISAANFLQASELAGPRVRIAVSRLAAGNNLNAQYPGLDIGGGIGSQLATELARSTRFLVLERALVEEVFWEQELGAKQFAAAGAAPPAGRMLGAQLLITGAVTEFSQASHGVRIGVSLPRVLSGASGGLEIRSARVTVELRAIDTTTSRVLHAIRAQGSARGPGLSVNAEAVRPITLGGDLFRETALGKATRQAIETAVAQLAPVLEHEPWSGRVVEVAGARIYLNAGAEDGVRTGDTFSVCRVRKELTDPATGASLGAEEDKLGLVRVEKTEAKYAIARALGNMQARRGDWVRP